MNKRKKIFILLKIILILFLVSIYFSEGGNNNLNGIYKKWEILLGVFSWTLIPYLILSIYSDFIIDKVRSANFKLRLTFVYILWIFIWNLKLLFYIDNYSEDITRKEVFIYLYAYKNLGMIVTMILYKLYFFVTININIAITGTILFFSSFILFGKIIGNIVRKIIGRYGKEGREKKKKREQLKKEKEMNEKKILEQERQEKIDEQNHIATKNAQEKYIKEEIQRYREIKEKKKG